MTMINYGYLNKALKACQDFGYQRIEVPWWVSPEVDRITKPANATSYKLSLNGKHLLASGEQAFIYLFLKGQLPPGRYCTMTPCFREESYDDWHSKHFMKVEMINIFSADADAPQDTWQGRIDQMAEDGRDIMSASTSRFDSNRVHMVPIQCEGSSNDPAGMVLNPRLFCIDIEYILNMKDPSARVELGSYGARRCSFAKWVYGTALAEPRFSKVLAASR